MSLSTLETVNKTPPIKRKPFPNSRLFPSLMDILKIKRINAIIYPALISLFISSITPFLYLYLF